MTSRHVFVADETVLGFFTDRSGREREELLRIFNVLADGQDSSWKAE